MSAEIDEKAFAADIREVLCDIMYSSISFGKSTLPQNRQLNSLIDNSEQ